MSPHVLAQRTLGVRRPPATVGADWLSRVALGLFLIGSAVPKLVGGSATSLGSALTGDAAAAAIERVTLGLVTGQATLLVTAALEVLIGALLLGRRSWRAGVVLLAGALVATVSPLLVFVDHVLAWPRVRSALGVADILLACLAMVVVACAFAGDREPG
jgi:hypothetical protein